MVDHPKTTCALLTPPGRGAVAVIALYGSDAQKALEANFQPANGKPYSAQQSRKIMYGVWSSTGEDLIVYRRPSGSAASFEVHCHGGSMASQAIIGDLESAGLQQVSAAQFIHHWQNQLAETNAGASWKSDILVALSQATTNRTAEILLRQLTLVPQEIDAVVSEIGASDFNSAKTRIETMLNWTAFGTQLTQPRVVVFCGKPNVGKSSLVNAIVGFQRAIVNEVAGTTRDVVSQSTAIDGWPVELRDTAGLRESENVIETIGVQKAHAEIAAADLRICVFDGSRNWDEHDQELLEAIEPDLVVFNKSDLADQTEIGNRLNQIPDSVVTSVESGAGIDSLIQQIGIRLAPELPESDQAVPVSTQQVARLEAAVEILKGGLTQKNLGQSERLSIAAEALEHFTGSPTR